MTLRLAVAHRPRSAFAGRGRTPCRCGSNHQRIRPSESPWVSNLLCTRALVMPRWTWRYSGFVTQPGVSALATGATATTPNDAMAAVAATATNLLMCAINKVTRSAPSPRHPRNAPRMPGRRRAEAGYSMPPTPARRPGGKFASHVGDAVHALSLPEDESPVTTGDQRDQFPGHCCVEGLVARGRLFSRDFFRIGVGVRRVPLPAGGDLGGGAVVPAVRPVLPRCRGTACRARRRCRSRHHLPVGATVHPGVCRGSRSRRHCPGDRWFVDETYVKVVGRWTYLYRAIDQHGPVIDVWLWVRRDLTAARGVHQPRARQWDGARRGHHGPGAGLPAAPRRVRARCPSCRGAVCEQRC